MKTVSCLESPIFMKYFFIIRSIFTLNDFYRIFERISSLFHRVRKFVGNDTLSDYRGVLVVIRPLLSVGQLTSRSSVRLWQPKMGNHEYRLTENPDDLPIFFFRILFNRVERSIIYREKNCISYLLSINFAFVTHSF